MTTQPARTQASLHQERINAARAKRMRSGNLSRGDVATLIGSSNQTREIPPVTLPRISIQHVEAAE